jgi:hypothetical protein
VRDSGQPRPNGQDAVRAPEFQEVSARQQESKWRRRQWPTSFAVRKYRTVWMRESVRVQREEEAFYDAGELRTVLPMGQP